MNTFYKCLWIDGNSTVWKASVFGVFLVRVFLHSDWIRKDTPYLSIRKIRTRKNPNKDSFHVVQNGYKSLKNDDYRSIIKGNGLWRSLYLGFIHLVRAQNFSKNYYFLPTDTHTYVNEWSFIKFTILQI